MTELKKKPLFNPEGDPDVRLRRMIGGNTTNLNDFNNSGSQYAYTLTVSAASLAINVKVLDWDEQDTSVSWQ